MNTNLVMRLSALGALALSPYLFAIEDAYQDHLSHKTPYIPPQCYVDPKIKTADGQDSGAAVNPCFTCHTVGHKPNFLMDSDVQLAYGFPESGLKNPWKNALTDNTERLQAISDTEILAWVKQNNYLDQNGQISLVKSLQKEAERFDSNGNKRWDGYVPDAWFNFDSEGFDRNAAGELSGWRSFAYYPMPGAFMPTNGATDDVLIRLPEIMQQNNQGEVDLEIYKINLAIVEALIKEKDVAISPVDEKKLGVDLDKDGKLTQASLVRYDWAPLKKRFMSYVGKAKQAQEQGKLHLAARLYPEGTEFLHTVRYLDLDEQGRVSMSARIKELRYARKNFWVNYYGHEVIAGKEIKERHDFPNRSKTILGSVEEGLSISQGWVYQAFIEDRQGELRPQNYEEMAFCVGCHSGVGVVIDSSFAFNRKLPDYEFQQGWYHWSQKGFEATAEPKRESDGEYEYSFYLKHNPTGDEFRANTEVQARFFDQSGKPRKAAFDALHKDISTLLLPSADRALKLNKAYKLIVDEQSYHLGRDPVIGSLKNVMHSAVEVDQATGVKEELSQF